MNDHVCVLAIEEDVICEFGVTRTTKSKKIPYKYLILGFSKEACRWLIFNRFEFNGIKFDICDASEEVRYHKNEKREYIFPASIYEKGKYSVTKTVEIGLDDKIHFKQFKETLSEFAKRVKSDRGCPEICPGMAVF